MSAEVYMPKFGMTMKEGTIIRWLKKEGETVNKAEPVAEVESEKITMTVDAPAAGVLYKVLFPEGTTVEIGKVIAYIDEASAAKQAGAPPGQAEEPGLAAKAVEDETPMPFNQARPSEPADSFKTVREIRPYAGLRKTIGERMAESLRRSPQGTMTVKADMSGVLAFKKQCFEKGHKVSVTDILIKITGLALDKNPILNASIEDDKIVLYKSINIGVGVAAENGLMVPVIRNVEGKSVFEISAEMKELMRKIGENRITSNDMKGGTFTVSNMGMFEVDIITAIINPPEAAILAVGSTRREMVVLEDDTTQIRPVTTLCLTADHAVMDGLPATKFLKDMKEIMKAPEEHIV